MNSASAATYDSLPPGSWWSWYAALAWILARDREFAHFASNFPSDEAIESALAQRRKSREMHFETLGKASEALTTALLEKSCLVSHRAPFEQALKDRTILISGDDLQRVFPEFDAGLRSALNAAFERRGAAVPKRGPRERYNYDALKQRLLERVKAKGGFRTYAELLAWCVENLKLKHDARRPKGKVKDDKADVHTVAAGIKRHKFLEIPGVIQD
jgi:hypothetical protein